MTDTTSWKEFFDAHAPVYERNAFTKNTVHEVDFLIEELGLPPSAAILDVGCGTGRHSVELARRGYAVTGLDLSAGMLAEARAASAAAGVEVEWVQADATRFTLPRRYDAALCLCEGAFGLLARADDPIQQPLRILSNVSRSLEPQAMVGLSVVHIWGGTAGKWGRRTLDLDEMEMMVVARKTAEPASSDRGPQQV